MLNRPQRTPAPILNTLKAKLSLAVGENKKMQEEIADVLQLSKESVYRRFRGDASFTLDELWILSRTYNIGFSDILKTEKEAIWEFEPFYSTGFSVEDYLMNLLTALDSIDGATLNSFLGLACDIPLFRFFGYGALAEFKLFYWESLFKKGGMAKSPFQLGNINYQKATSAIYSRYAELPSHEIWSFNTLRGTLSQIEYYYESGLIKDEETLGLLYRDLFKLTEDVIYESEESNSKVSIYELSFNNNSFLVKTPEKKLLTIGVNSINSVRTDDEHLITEFEQWLEVVVSRSLKISGRSSKLKHQVSEKLKLQIKTSAHSLGVLEEA